MLDLIQIIHINNKYYCGPVIYEDGQLKRILTPEGYLSPNGTQFHYNYFVNDYLGNVRTVLTYDTSSTYSVSQKTDYYAFGLPTYNSLNPEAQPYKREGKGYDEMHGLNMYDQGARFFGAALPVSTTIDPLAEKYYNISPYAQWGNNPVRYVDPDGRDPGDVFETIREAAIDWGMYYNGASILRDKEFVSTIYIARENEEKIGYSYSEANIGTKHRVNPSMPPNFIDEVADIHSHGTYDEGLSNSNFAPTDIADNNRRKNIGYLATPDGSLKEYNSSTKNIETITTTLPSDPNDPGRKNNINPTDIPLLKSIQKMGDDLIEMINKLIGQKQ